MSKRTLLSMVQGILRSMDSDSVNSISDTLEGTDVANIIKENYEKLVTIYSIPRNKALIKLTALGDVNKPTYFQLPEAVVDVFTFEVRYDKRLTASAAVDYNRLTYLHPHDFMELSMNRTSTDSTVQTVTDFSTNVLLIRNDKHPEYYTSFDDKYMVCDSFYSTLDATLQQSKLQVYGEQEQAFTLSDSFIPELPADLFPLLYEKSKVQAHYEMQQSINQLAAEDTRRLTNRMQTGKFAFSKPPSYNDYGRRR